VAKLWELHSDLRLSIDTVRAEEAANYLLLSKGEVVVSCHHLAHPDILFEPLITGELYCIAPLNHPLAGRDCVSVRDIAPYPVIGVDRNDPHGRFITNLFAAYNQTYDVAVRAISCNTVSALVGAGIGLGIINQFSLIQAQQPNLKVLKILEPTTYPIGIA